LKLIFHYYLYFSKMHFDGVQFERNIYKPKVI
jgi:hypothetical protein